MDADEENVTTALLAPIPSDEEEDNKVSVSEERIVGETASYQGEVKTVRSYLDEANTISQQEVTAKKEDSNPYDEIFQTHKENYVALPDTPDPDRERRLQEILNRKERDLAASQPDDDCIVLIAGHKVSLWAVWEGFVKLLVIAALTLLAGNVIMRYRRHMSGAVSANSNPLPTTPVSEPVDSEDAVVVNSGLTVTMDTVDQQYFDILKLPSNSLFMVPNRESTVTIGGVSPGCSLYWSLSSVDDSTIRFHGTSDETIPATLEVTPRVSGKYDLTLEEKCFHNQIIMRTLYLVVYVQELRRNLRFTDKTSGEKVPF